MIDPGIKKHRDHVDEEVGEYLCPVRAVSLKCERPIHVEGVDRPANVSHRFGEELEVHHPHDGAVQDEVDDDGATARDEIAGDLTAGRLSGEES